MTDLNQTLLQKASGENRLNPDEQRYYMGTFRERVVLTVSFEEATATSFTTILLTICRDLTRNYQPLFLKISPKLSDSLQISYMKTAQEYGIIVSVIDEATSTSPFALLFHTDQAVDLDDVSMETHFPQQKAQDSVDTSPKKRFWKKLFGA